MPKVITFELGAGHNNEAKIISVEGAGDGCLDLTKPYEEALGGAQEGTRVLTDEINQSCQQKNNSEVST